MFIDCIYSLKRSKFDFLQIKTHLRGWVKEPNVDAFNAYIVLVANAGRMVQG